MSDRRDPTLDPAKLLGEPESPSTLHRVVMDTQQGARRVQRLAHHDDFGVRPVVLIGTQASG